MADDHKGEMVRAAAVLAAGVVVANQVRRAAAGRTAELLGPEAAVDAFEAVMKELRRRGLMDTSAS